MTSKRHETQNFKGNAKWPSSCFEDIATLNNHYSDYVCESTPATTVFLGLLNCFASQCLRYQKYAWLIDRM